jgi:hypothetical protein
MSVVLLTSLVMLVRGFFSSTNLHSSVWAEDGWIPLCVVARGNGSCLAEQVNGYWPIVHRLLAEPLSMLPLTWWPMFFPVLAALITALLILLIFRTLQQVVGILAAIAGSVGIVLTPALGMEFINVVGNVHWILLMAAMVLLISPIRKERFRVVLLLVFMAGIANPASFVLVVLVGLLSFVGGMESKEALKIGFSAMFGWLIQLLAILGFSGTDRVGTSFTIEEKMLNVVNSFLGVIPGLRIDSTQSVSFLATSTRLTPYVCFLVLLAFLVALIANRRNSLTMRKFASFGVTTQILSIFLLLILDPNPRYVFVVVALNLVWVVGMVGVFARQPRIMYAFVVGLVLMSLPGFSAGPYRSTPSDVSWSDQLEKARRECAQGAERIELHFAPERSYPTMVECSRL